MILEIDAGNTALKWRILAADSTVLHRGRSVHYETQQFCDVAKRFPSLSMVRLSSVAKPEVESSIADLVYSLWDMPTEVAKTKSNFAGLTVVYDDPSRLGVDRWLAMLAARSLNNGAICVVDCGSAITVDLVAADGKHQGGYIVPGLAMQQKALLNSTSQIRFEKSAEKKSTLWGCSTEEAVSFGVLQMVISFVDAIVDRLPGSGESVALFLTGGDAAVLRPLLKHGERFYERPELVMDGLAIALPEAI